jgi:EAL domain-containing protein (putative c-di-GMP-specific phosphodiesterase class I)
MSVNTTVADLLDIDFPTEVSAALAARGIPPDALVLELTETSIMQLGHHVIAEGVEDDLTWSALTGLGCDRIQGYALGKPTAAVDFQRLLTESEGDAVTASALGQHLVDL